MLPCCDFCYDKFLEPDRSLDLEAFAQSRNDLILRYKDHLVKYPKDSGAMKEMEKVESMTEPKCRCVCHVKGMCVLH